MWALSLENSIKIHFQLDPMDNLSQMTLMSTYLMGVLAQISVPCHFGSRLLNASEGIGRAIYKSPWHRRDHKCKRAYMVFVECTLRPIAIRAGGLFMLSLPTFVSVSTEPGRG